MYGVKARLPLDLESGQDEATADDLADAVVVDSTTGYLKETRAKAKENIEESQAKQKTRYDIKHQGPSFAVGQQVLKYNRRRDTRMGDKLGERYTGPFLIVECLAKGVFRLQDGDKILKQTVNALNLKLWIPSCSPSSTPCKSRRKPTFPGSPA